IAFSIAGLPGAHCLRIAFPVPRPQVFRDDDVERLPDRLVRREAEDPFASGIPHADDALVVGEQDAVGYLGEEGLIEVRNSEHRRSPFSLMARRWRSRSR